jgi:LuxR family glucitol operon transcriptional activator
MTNRSDAFGRLLKAGISSIANCEGKTAPIIEEDLGQQIGLASHSIQRYKSGHLPPEARAIRVLAEACVRRGFLGREWLQRFLDAASYPKAAELLDQLCPIGPARPRPPRVYENLPAPTYSQFVMRAQAFAEALDGLQQRSAAVLIIGLGGNGKTSLAREVAARCLRDGEEQAPHFDAVVWVSDKDRPGTTNLSIVLDEVARTLDYPGFTQFAHDEKRREVEQLLRRQRVLLVVDNFETITDGALLTWLLRLPEPSKALITSREYSRAFRSNTFVFNLRGMSDVEGSVFIDQRLRFLRIEQLVNDSTQLEPLVATTGGNPKAIEVALGLVKHDRRPLQQVVDDLHAARGNLFDDLFTRAWSLLDEAARCVLLSMTFFPDSTSAAALRATADVQGFAFDRSVERLTDLALLDVQQADLNSARRYALHPLVQAFAVAQLAKQPGFEAAARGRWVQWYMQLTAKVSGWGNDLIIYEIFAPEQETAFSVIKWTLQNQLYAETLQIANGVGYYYNMRGLWDKNLSINLMGAEAARILSDVEAEVRLLSFHLQRLSVQGNIAEVEKHLLRLQAIGHSTGLPAGAFFVFQRTMALYWMACQDFDTAQQVLEQIVDCENSSPHIYVVNRLWLARCLYRKGMLAEARQLFRATLHDALQYNYTRSSISIQNQLAAIDLDQGRLEDAATLLAESSIQAYQYQVRGEIASIQRLSARLHTLRSNLPAARAALTEAIDLFERLGVRRELAEAREALADLDARERVAARQARPSPDHDRRPK